MSGKITKEERQSHKEFLREQKKLDKKTPKISKPSTSIRKGVIS